jgi:PTH1 family peptidyl-tRNA hydrolase
LRVVLGLGNDGPEYRFTRHNVGFMVADEIALRCGAAFAARGELGRLTWTAETDYGGQRVVLAKPRTLMNRSGAAAMALRKRYGAAPSDFIVVFDDADLALGRVRVRPEGGAGGHNGVRSLIELLAARDFPRVKLGVLGDDRRSRELADYVLAPFRPDERPIVGAMVATGADAVQAVLVSGVETAQRAFNGPPS